MIYLYSGTWGVGKSSLLAKLANDCAFDFKNIAITKSWLKDFYKERGLDYDIPEHFVFSTDKMFFKRVGYSVRESHDIEPERFGVQKYAPEGIKCQFFPEGSQLFFDEGHSIFPAKEDLPMYKKVAINIQRHARFDIHVATPRFMDVNNVLRTNAVGIYIKRRNEKITENKVNICWEYDIIPPGNIDAYLEAKPSERRRFCKSGKVVEKEINVFNIYDAYCHAKDFVEGLSGNDFKIV